MDLDQDRRSHCLMAMVCYAMEIAIRHYSYEDYHSRYQFDAGHCSSVARASSEDRNLLDVTLGACRLRRLRWLESDGLAFDSRLEDDLGEDCCSCIEIQLGGVAWYS